MKNGLLFLLLLITQNAFALYGQKIEVSKDLFVVSLHIRDQYEPKYDYFCSGVLISPTKILTAGHCIDSFGRDEYGSSHWLLYYPQLVSVKVGNKSFRAKSITLAPSYFEGIGHDAEDLALIELETKVTEVRPISLAQKKDLMSKAPVTLIARNKKVVTNLLSVKSYAETTVMFLNTTAGACKGDSGGAIVINKNGQQKLAGILMYNGEGTCDPKTGYGYFPKSQFSELP
jgi:V8-like Glu-specific endopeptidase